MPRKKAQDRRPSAEEVVEHQIRDAYKFKPKYVDEVRKLCALGATDPEIADFFQISSRQLIRWRSRFAEFAAACKAGKDEADDRVERALYQRAIGYTRMDVKVMLPTGAKKAEDAIRVPVPVEEPPNVTACLFWLKNRRKDKWRDRYEHTGADGGPLQVEQIQDALAKLNDKEIAALEKLIGPIAAAARVAPITAGGHRSRKAQTEH